MSAEVSARDAALRRTISELVVHLPCGQIRGPIDRIPARCDCAINRGRWQSCPCEDEPVEWPGSDVYREVDLCVLCSRGIAGGTSRWAWLGCGYCREVNDTAGHRGDPTVPLGRHSIMNGVGLKVPRTAEFEAQHSALVAISRSWPELGEWCRTEVRRLAGQRGWTGDRQILLRTWQAAFPASPEASLDAYRRFTGRFDPVRRC